MVLVAEPSHFIQKNNLKVFQLSKKKMKLKKFGNSELVIGVLRRKMSVSCDQCHLVTQLGIS